MKLTLIKPNIGRMEHSLYVDEGPHGAAAARRAGRAHARPHVEVVLYDDRMESSPTTSPRIWSPSLSRPTPREGRTRLLRSFATVACP
jgi:hypothetical protein